MHVVTLLIGLSLVACNTQTTKPIKKISVQNTTVEDEDGTSSRVRQTNKDGTVVTSTSTEESADKDIVTEEPSLALDCFDSELADTGAYLVDGHAELFVQEGQPSSICALLTDAQKDTAIVQYLPDTCTDCEQVIQNTWWAIERSGYQEQFLHILALPAANPNLAAQIQEFVEEASIPAVIITDAESKLALQLQANEQTPMPPKFYAINSLLEVDFIPGDDEQYLDIVAKAEAALLSVDTGAEANQQMPETTWDGISLKATGLIDIHSVTHVNEEGAEDVL
ncbi:MAG: hypothetical protein AB8G05_00360 [Oligoflexales bacterium]